MGVMQTEDGAVSDSTRDAYRAEFAADAGESELPPVGRSG